MNVWCSYPYLRELSGKVVLSRWVKGARARYTERDFLHITFSDILSSSHPSPLMIQFVEDRFNNNPD